MLSSYSLQAELPGCQSESTYTSLFLACQVKQVLPRCLTGYQSVPFDAYCPSVQSVLMRRICKKCELYHASLSSLKAHTRMCGVQQIIPRTRPVRLAARRQRELMAIIANNSGEEEAEWIEEEFLDASGLTIGSSNLNNDDGRIKVVTTAEHLASVWTEQ
jgi:hypothetical protein